MTCRRACADHDADDTVPARVAQRSAAVARIYLQIEHEHVAVRRFGQGADAALGEFETLAEGDPQ